MKINFILTSSVTPITDLMDSVEESLDDINHEILNYIERIIQDQLLDPLW